MTGGLTVTPFVSVVMPVYNSAAFLADAIESILSQTYPHFEFIIVDDGSTDGSVELIEKYSDIDGRIRPLYLSHCGAGGAANAGIAAARGDLVARMDSDDIALPERFATQVAWMRLTGVDICGSCVRTFGAEDRLMWFPETHDAIRVEMLFRCALMQPTVMLRTEIAKRHLYNESLYFEDYELWTRLAPAYRMGNVPQVLLRYRAHHQQRHVKHATDVCSELRNYCAAYFRTLVNDASPDDERLIVKIVANEPLESLADLERAGLILQRLAQVDDLFLQKRIFQRWLSTCHASTRLGIGCYRVFRRINSFGGEEGRNDGLFALACLLKIRPGRRLKKMVRLMRG